MRSLSLLVASSLLMFAAGCGDASDPSLGNPDPEANVSNSGSAAPAASSTASSASTAQPTGPVTPPTTPPSGNIYFRVANFTPSPADACISPDGGTTWVGPIMHQLAGKLADPSTVTARLTIPNAHFTARMTYGVDCTQPVGKDVAVTDIQGEWPATVVLGQNNGAPEMHVLADEPSLSPSSTFIRFVHAADWSMDADLGQDLTDCCGDTNYFSVFVDTPYLATAKQGVLSPQGYAALDPMDQIPMELRETTSQNTRATVTVTTDVNEKYSVFTMGDDTTTTLVFCDDAADPTSDHLTPCTTLNDGDTFQDAASQANGSGN